MQNINIRWRYANVLDCFYTSTDFAIFQKVIFPEFFPLLIKSLFDLFFWSNLASGSLLIRINFIDF